MRDDEFIVDSVVEETRRAREQLVADAHESGLTLVEFIKRAEVEHGARLVRRAPRPRIKPGESKTG